MTEYLVVYGSLRKGLGGYQEHLMQYEPIELIKLQGFDMYTITDLGYPFIVRGLGEITGEIYLVNMQKIEELDIFEECPQVYSRITVQINDKISWIYIYNQQDLGSVAGLEKISNGDWVDYVDNKNSQST